MQSKSSVAGSGARGVCAVDDDDDDDDVEDVEELDAVAFVVGATAEDDIDDGFDFGCCCFAGLLLAVGFVGLLVGVDDIAIAIALRQHANTSKVSNNTIYESELAAATTTDLRVRAAASDGAVPYCVDEYSEPTGAAAAVDADDEPSNEPACIDDEYSEPT